MEYRGYKIIRAEVVKMPGSGRRRGTVDLYDPNGIFMDSKTYTIGNTLSRQTAYRALCAKVDLFLDNLPKDKKK
jgi:hypothetical protein